MENKNIRTALKWMYLTAAILCFIAAVLIYFIEINPANIDKEVSRNGTFAEGIVQNYQTNSKVVNGVRYVPIVVHFEIDGVIYEGKTNYAYTREDAEAIVLAGKLNIKYKKTSSTHAIIVGAEFKETPVSVLGYPLTVGLSVFGLFGVALFIFEMVRKVKTSSSENAYAETKENYFAETKNKKQKKQKTKPAGKEDDELKYKIVSLPGSLVYVKSGTIKDLSGLTNFILKSEEYFRKLNPGVDCLNPNYSYITYGKKDENGIELEYTQAVAKLGLESKTLKFKKLESIRAASVTVTGHYSKLNPACRKLLDTLKEKNIKVTGEVRFCYLNGEWDTESSDNYKTEIQVLLES